MKTIIFLHFELPPTVYLNLKRLSLDRTQQILLKNTPKYLRGKRPVAASIDDLERYEMYAKNTMAIFYDTITVSLYQIRQVIVD